MIELKFTLDEYLEMNNELAHLINKQTDKKYYECFFSLLSYVIEHVNNNPNDKQVLKETDLQYARYLEIL